MSLTPEQRAARAGKITAGFLPYLMAGKEDRIMEEWMRLTEHPDFVEPQFDEWRGLYGNLIEPLALSFHERKTGKALVRTGKGLPIPHPTIPYVCSLPDAFREEDNCVIDCKAWSSWQKVDYICSFLAPQLIVQRQCVGAERMAILLVHGGGEPQEWPVKVEPSYEDAVFEKIAEFWECVQTLSPPFEIKAVAAPVVEAFREIDMSQSNAWAEHAGNWLQHRDGAKLFKTAETELKALVPPDGKRCYGHGISVSRSKAGSLTIKPGA